MVRSTSRRVATAATVACALVVSACSGDDGRTLRPPRPDQGESVAPATTVPPTFAVTGGWSDGGAIDVRHTCDGLNISPALSWSGAPAETVAFAISLRDEDAPDYGHWVVANIDPAATTFDEGATPEGVVVAENSAGREGYVGPCPPTGTSHTYTVTLYALAERVDASAPVSVRDLLEAVEGARIDAVTTTFTYAR